MASFTPIVTIPARNEEEQLPELFASLAAQTWLRQQNDPLKIVIALNNCTDNSLKAVLDARAAYPKLTIDIIDVKLPQNKSHVGTARRLAMDAALAICENPTETAILTTDGDSSPTPDWVANNLQHVADGIDLVCGLLWLKEKDFKALSTDFTARRQIDIEYNYAIHHLDVLLAPIPHNPWPNHYECSGATLAIRADVYQAIGGLPILPLREDIAFRQRALDAGYRVRHPMDVIVETSARMIGRADKGYANDLQNFEREASEEKPLLVEHPELTWKRLKAKQTIGQLADSELIPVEEAMVLLKRMIVEAGGSHA